MLTWKPTWNDGTLSSQCLESPNPSGDIEFQELYSTSVSSACLCTQLIFATLSSACGHDPHHMPIGHTSKTLLLELLAPLTNQNCSSLTTRESDEPCVHMVILVYFSMGEWHLLSVLSDIMGQVNEGGYMISSDWLKIFQKARKVPSTFVKKYN